MQEEEDKERDSLTADIVAELLEEYNTLFAHSKTLTINSLEVNVKFNPRTMKYMLVDSAESLHSKISDIVGAELVPESKEKYRRAREFVNDPRLDDPTVKQRVLGHLTKRPSGRE